MPVTPNNIRDAKKYIHNMSPTGGMTRNTDEINCVIQLTTTGQRVVNELDSKTLGFIHGTKGSFQLHSGLCVFY